MDLVSIQIKKSVLKSDFKHAFFLILAHVKNQMFLWPHSVPWFYLSTE